MNYKKLQKKRIEDKKTTFLILFVLSAAVPPEVIDYVNTDLDIANYLSVIHYPHSSRQSILQGILPINQQLIKELVYD